MWPTCGYPREVLLSSACLVSEFWVKRVPVLPVSMLSILVIALLRMCCMVGHSSVVCIMVAACPVPQRGHGAVDLCPSMSYSFTLIWLRNSSMKCMPMVVGVFHICLMTSWSWLPASRASLPRLSRLSQSLLLMLIRCCLVVFRIPSCMGWYWVSPLVSRVVVLTVYSSSYHINPTEMSIIVFGSLYILSASRSAASLPMEGLSLSPVCDLTWIR